MESERVRRPYYGDPTANAAIGNVMREEREKKRLEEIEQKRAILKDLTAVQRQAKRMDCRTVTFKDIPVENVELVIGALRASLRR